MYKAALFDLDGTLVKSLEDHFLAWKYTFLLYGKILREDDYFPYEGEKLNKLIERVFDGDDHDAEKIMKEKDDYYQKNSRFELYEGVEAYLSGLKTNGIKTAIVTAGRRERLVATATTSFLDFFDTIITYGDTEKAKPYPDPYLLAVHRLDLNPEDCVVIENAPLGVQSAVNAGIYCVAISSTVSKDRLIEADIILENFRDLSKLELFNLFEEIP